MKLLVARELPGTAGNVKRAAEKMQRKKFVRAMALKVRGGWGGHSVCVLFGALRRPYIVYIRNHK